MQGTIVNGYSLVSLIGRGGMAEVWKAQNSLGVSVAIKVLNANLLQDANIVERFKGEARIMASLWHTNIREVRDLATMPDGRPCIIMEFLEGADLASRMKSGERFTDAQLRKWWNQMVDALNYTHLHGVIHRDIKPSNIFVTDSGDVKLLDFGIAKNADNHLSTMTGAKMGTLMYMSPEQVKDAKHIDEKSDVYSLAVTFVHLVSGRSPYASDTSEYGIMTSIVNTPLDTSTLPEPWRRWLNLYLAKDPQSRPQLKRIPENGSPSDGTMVDGGVGGTKDRTIVDSGLYLTVTKGKTYFSAGGGNSSVLVKTNGEYSLQLPKDGWVSGRKYGTNGYSLFISKNTSKTARKSPVKIIFTKGIETKEETFNITQEGRKSLWWIWLIVAFVILFATMFVIAINSNKGNNYSTTKTETKATSGYLNGHEWVDLGLPSGTKWATHNLGTTFTNGYGDYYAWGEIRTKNSFTEKGYRYTKDPFYANPSRLYGNDDAATVIWGNGWYMPTCKDFDELKNCCTCIWTTNGKTHGYSITGPNGNSIFLPAAGFYTESGYSDADICGYYWSCMLCEDHTTHAALLYFDSSDYGKSFCGFRYYGMSIRPVCK